MSTHTELLVKAKQHQKDKFNQSAALNNQLRTTLSTIIRSNSVNDANGPTCLDKITTIRDLDREIDRQMNEDIASSYEQLMGAKKKLVGAISKTKKALQASNDTNWIDAVQRRAEVVDQEIRILEATLKIIKTNRDR